MKDLGRSPKPYSLNLDPDTVLLASECYEVTMGVSDSGRNFKPWSLTLDPNTILLAGNDHDGPFGMPLQ